MATSKPTKVPTADENPQVPETQAERLAKPFPASVIKKVKQGNAVLDYIPVAEVVQRMNTVLGPGNWSREIMTIGRDSTDLGWVVATVRVTAKIDGEVSISDAVGAKEIMTYKNSVRVVDLGNDFKSAYSEAMKKACQGFGVGLYLARSEEEVDFDNQAPSSDVPPPAKATQPVVSDAEWSQLIEYMAQMDDTQKGLVREWWQVNGVGEKPTRSTITRKLFEELLARVTAELFDGAVVSSQPF